MAISTGIAALIVAGIGAGSNILGSRSASGSANRAAQLQHQTQQEALAFQREQAAAEERRYEEQQRYAREQWDAQQALRAPYRAAAASILRQYGINTGIQTPQMPTGWRPGDPTRTVSRAATPQEDLGVGNDYLGGMSQTDALSQINPLANSRPRTLAELTASWRL